MRSGSAADGEPEAEYQAATLRQKQTTDVLLMLVVGIRARG